MKYRILTLLFFFTLLSASAQINYTAKDVLNPYNGPFRPGCNLAYFPNWTTNQLADLAAGNPNVGVPGVGAKTLRPVLAENVLEIFGYDAIKPNFEHFEDLGLDEHTVTLAWPVAWHQDLTEYCPGKPSALFANLYLPIWDGGANGTPVNDDNYFALYVWKTVTTYNEYVRFWEIWNEPGFDETGNTGWREPGDPIGNWWDNDPQPCEYILHAPIQHYVRTMRVAYEVIKTVAPEDYVVVAGFGYQSFLDAVLRNTDNPVDGSVTAEYPHGGGAYFDVMGLHAYPHFDGSTTNYDANFFARHSDAAADGLLGRRQYYQEVLDRHGFDGITYPKKETIVTEINVPREFAGGSEFFASNEGQRNYIIKVLVKAKLNRVHQLHVFGLSDNPGQPYGFDVMGLYNDLSVTQPYNQIPNDEAWAYKTASDLLFNTTYDDLRTSQMNLPAGIRGHAFRNPNNTFTYVMWAETTIDKSESASANYSFPANMNVGTLKKQEWNASQTGVQSNTAPQNIQLTGAPIFLIEQAGDGGDLRPSVSLTTPLINVSGPFVVDITFSEAVSDLTIDDFNVTNGTLSGLTGSGQSYAVTATHLSAGVMSIELPAEKAFDSIGQGNSSSNILFVGRQNGGGGGTNGVDLELSIQSSQQQFSKFENITYTLRLRNTGNSNASGIQVRFPSPAGMAYVSQTESQGVYYNWTGDWLVGGLAAGQSATMTLTLFTLNDATAITAFAQVSAMNENDSDSSPDNNAGVIPAEDDEAAVTITPGNGGGGPLPCSLNATIQDLTCDNNGTPADPNDDGFQFALLANGQNTSGNWTAIIPDFAGTGTTTINGTYGTSALVSFSGAGVSIPYNQILTFDVTDNADPNCKTSLSLQIPAPCSNGGGGGNNGVDLSLSLEVDKTNFVLFENVTYLLEVKNEGTEEATQVVIDFPMPDGLVYVSQVQTKGTYDNWLGTWKLDDIPAGGVERLELTLFTLKDDAPITNFAQVTEVDQDDADSTPDNNTGLIPAEDDEAAVTIYPGTNFRNGQANRKIQLEANQTMEVVRLFPNPASDELHILINGPKDGRSLHLRIFNLLGEEMAMRPIQLTEGYNDLQLDIRSLPGGMYYLLFDTPNRHEPILFIKERL